MENYNTNVKNIIKKWYDILQFPTKYDVDFLNALNNYEIDSNTNIKNYDFTCEDGKKNLLSFLYMCENTYKELIKKSVPENIIIDTLKDIVTWTKTWSEVKKELYLGEIFWLKHHHLLEIFKIGRLQFLPSKFKQDFPEFNIKKGDNVVEIHIPEGEKLSKEVVDKSISDAKIFIKQIFPDFDYHYFSCYSWLLDEKLLNYLPKESNILSFANRFIRIKEKPSNAILKFIISWDTTSENLNEKNPTSPFANAIKDAFLNGERFNETLGIMKK